MIYNNKSHKHSKTLHPKTQREYTFLLYIKQQTQAQYATLAFILKLAELVASLSPGWSTVAKPAIIGLVLLHLMGHVFKKSNPTYLQFNEGPQCNSDTASRPQSTIP